MRCALLLLLLLPACNDFGVFSSAGSVDAADEVIDMATSSIDGGADQSGSGPRWQAQESSTVQELHAVWGSAGEVWAVGANGTAVRRSGTGTWMAVNTTVMDTLWSVWGAPHDVWMAGEGGRVVHIVDNTVSSQVTARKGTLQGGSGSVMVGAGGSVYRNVLGKWVFDQVPGAGDLFGAWEVGTGDAWAVGARGLVLHVTVTSSTEPSFAQLDLRGVWADVAGTVIAVGGKGTIVRRALGGGWSPVTSSENRDLWAVSGSDSKHVWAVGSSGAIRFSNDEGASWTSQVGPSGQQLFGVWAAGPEDVYAVGGGGVILHFGK